MAIQNLDFNDLHQAAGLEEVRRQVQAAIDAHQSRQDAAKVVQPKAGQHISDPGHMPTVLTGSNAASPNDRFLVDDSGVWYIPPGDDGRPLRLCGPLRVTGLARDSHDNQAALLLEFDTDFRKGRRWLMPLTMLSGDGAAYRSALLSQGFMAPTDGKRRLLLTTYLQSRPTAELVRHVPRVGWHGRCYVLPEETLGTNPDGDRVIFHSEVGIEANFNQRGKLEAWKQNLSRLCVDNTRLTFAVSTAFAGPLLAWASGTTGGGFHFTGATSIGKTTGFLIAASVWGKGTEKDPDSYMQKWRATSNGLEYQGEQHNDCTLILDELGQMDASDAGQAAYMLADGMGKTRGKGAGGLRAKPTWRLLFLSSGELSLAQHMESVGKKMKGGQEVRLIPIPAEVQPGSAMETCHEFDSGHELSGHVQHHAARTYGVAGRAWLDYLVANIEGLASRLRERMNAIELQMVPESASGQVKRGGRRFTLVAAAGELATEAGLTGWPAGEATQRVTACFNAWLESRGGSGSSEVSTMLRTVVQFIEAHAEDRFTWWQRAEDDHNAKTLNRVGFRRFIDASGKIKPKPKEYRAGNFDDEGYTTEYLIFTESFKTEVCKGLDYKAVCELLKEHGVLVHDEGRHTSKQRLPGSGMVNCIRISHKIHELSL